MHDSIPQWTDDEGQRASLHNGVLRVYGQPLVEATEGVMVEVSAQHVADLIDAARDLRWNALDGFDQDSPIIVSRESWSRLQRARVALLAKADRLCDAPPSSRERPT